VSNDSIWPLTVGRVSEAMPALRLLLCEVARYAARVGMALLSIRLGMAYVSTIGSILAEGQGACRAGGHAFLGGFLEGLGERIVEGYGHAHIKAAADKRQP
jgi:hypothetical protein